MSKYEGLTPDPTYVKVWQKALEKSLTITLRSKPEQSRLRAQLYRTRKILLANEHPLAKSIAALSISQDVIKDPRTGALVHRLLIDSSDQEIKDQLEDLLSEDNFEAEQSTGEKAPDLDFLNQSPDHAKVKSRSLKSRL